METVEVRDPRTKIRYKAEVTQTYGFSRCWKYPLFDGKYRMTRIEITKEEIPVTVRRKMKRKAMLARD